MTPANLILRARPMVEALQPGEALCVRSSGELFVTTEPDMQYFMLVVHGEDPEWGNVAEALEGYLEQ